MFRTFSFDLLLEMESKIRLETLKSFPFERGSTLTLIATRDFSLNVIIVSAHAYYATLNCVQCPAN